MIIKILDLSGTCADTHFFNIYSAFKYSSVLLIFEENIQICAIDSRSPFSINIV